MTEHMILVGLRLSIVAVGGLLTLWSLRLAVKRRGARASYLLLTLGFGLITLGALVEGLLFEIAGWDLASAHAVEAVVSGSGFVVILLSIFRSSNIGFGTGLKGVQAGVNRERPEGNPGHDRL